MPEGLGPRASTGVRGRRVAAMRDDFGSLVAERVDFGCRSRFLRRVRFLTFPRGDFRRNLFRPLHLQVYY